MTYYVDAVDGDDLSNPGTSPGFMGAWKTVSNALANIPPAMGGNFQTLFIAGRYGTSGAVMAYDEQHETWSSGGPRLVPPYIQVLYDTSNSEVNSAGVRAPVIFDATGSGASTLFLFNTTLNEPASRFDGTNTSSDEAIPTPHFIVRGCAIAFEVLPPAGLPAVPPGGSFGAQPPGAEFQAIRFENCGSGISIEAGIRFGTTPSSTTLTETFSAVVQSCQFTSMNVGASASGSYIYVLARENAVGPYEAPSVVLTVLGSNFEFMSSPGGGQAYAINLRALGGPGGPFPGSGGASGTIVALVDDCRFTNQSSTTVSLTGIYADADSYFGTISLTVEDSSINGFNQQGLGYRKLDEGFGALTVRRTSITNCGGTQAASNAFFESGLSVEAAHNSLATGYNTASTFVTVNLDDVICSSNRFHGAYFHIPVVANIGSPPIILSTDLSLNIRSSDFFANGYASTAPGTRVGSGIAVHVEQGRLVGPQSTINFIPPSAIVGNDVYNNALHGIELRGGAQSFASYGVGLEGTVANNVVDFNGFPTFAGPSFTSYELFVDLDQTNNTQPVISRLLVTQNTFFDDQANEFVLFSTLSGARHNLTSFLANLGAQRTYNMSGLVFRGFGTSTSPADVRYNTGRFDDPNLFANGNLFSNATDTELSTFSAVAGGHYVNPAARDYQLQTLSGTFSNPAIDRAPMGVMGQQPLDKEGRNRNFDNPSIPGPDISDAGANENQG